MKVSMSAFKLGITGFILPFAFAFNPDYLTIGFNLTTLVTMVSAVVVSYSVAIFLQGYVEKKTPVWERLLYLGIAAVAITPYIGWSLLAAAVFAVAYTLRKIEAKKALAKA
jgi:TRAP-type uncharacterized transport system fused permease subunit